MHIYEHLSSVSLGTSGANLLAGAVYGECCEKLAVTSGFHVTWGRCYS